MVEKRILGRTGLPVAVLGFGGIPIQRLPETEAVALLRLAFDRGVNFVDSARGYTDSESKIGRALDGRRHEIVVATKAMPRDRAKMASQIEASLRELRTDYIDLYQVHGIETREQLDQVLGPGGAFEALDRARDAGRVRFIGVTGHMPDALRAAVETGLFDTVQLPFNPLETAWQTGLLAAARDLGLGAIGMKPIGGGALVRASEAIRFALTEGVDVVIPGMENASQLEANLAAARSPQPLTAGERARFEEEGRRLGPTFCRRCGYCMPCDNSLHIPFLLLLKAYYERYGLRAWAMERLGGFDKRYGDCQACGACVERCPYRLPVPELMQSAAKTMR